MKKIIALGLCLCGMQGTFAFTTHDITMAQELADQNIINNQSMNPILYKLDASITRVELLKIALKVRGVNSTDTYTCKNYYLDVGKKQAWFCPVVEKAADEGIITRENKKFRPQETITRAEALAILLRAGNIEVTTDCGGSSCTGISIDSSIDWHLQVFMTALYKGIVIPDRSVQEYTSNGSTLMYTFRPQKPARRADVFGFAKSILDFKNIISVQQPIPAPSLILSPEAISSVKNNAYIQGNKDATLLLVEYGDLECPFCKKMHDDHTILDLQKKYGTNLAYIFKHYPLPFHPFALPAAHAAECVGKQGGSDAYYTFIDNLYYYDSPNPGNIDATLATIGFSTVAVRTCLRDTGFQTKVDADTAEGTNTFGINGTPGNVLINTKTGQVEVVSGAQPLQNFIDAAERLLK